MRLNLVGRYIAPEMFALWLIEVLLTFALLLILITPATGGVGLESVNPAMICALTVGFTAFIIGIYRPQIFVKVQTLIKSTLLAALLSFPAVWLVCKVFGFSTYFPIGYDALRPVKIVALWCAGLLLTRLLFMSATKSGLFVHRVAIVGSDMAPSIAATMRAKREGALEICLVPPEEASASQLNASKIRTIILNADIQTITPTIIAEYLKRGIQVKSESEFWEHHLRRVDILSISDATLKHCTDHQKNTTRAILSRSFDLTLSLILLVSTLPIVCIVAILVRLDSAGPVFYKQERVGFNGVKFTLLKFRSMKIDAEANGPRWAQMRDPRVTRLGFFMRKTRIDELPQLLNIMRGEMSFIGPRPERPHFVSQLEEVIPHYCERCRVKPGLTGWAQVNYPYGASIEDARAKLSYDLYYVKNRSFLLDVIILLSTVRVILFQEGAR